jgi:hypothetical protein
LIDVETERTALMEHGRWSHLRADTRRFPFILFVNIYLLFSNQNR